MNATSLFLAAVLASAAPTRTVWSAAQLPAAAKSDRSAVFFGDPKVRVFELELSESAQETLRRNPRNYVRGTVREGDQVFANVGIRLKGMGSFQPLDQKPSFVLNFDEFVPDRNYYSLTKLMLDNSIQDKTYLAELLATGLFRAADVPASRVTHARVVLNGRALGLYTAIEAMNKRFLKRHFGNNTGNLYEGYLRDIDTRLDQDNGTNTTQADVRALLAACQIDGHKERFQRLSQLLDLDRFISFAAMEVLTAQWDGYTLHTNNYRLYHDAATDKMVFITHGLDAVFRRLNLSIEPPVRSAVSQALFQTDEGRRLYNSRLRALYTNVFRLEVITNRMDEALTKLRAAQLPDGQFEELERHARLMRTRIIQRMTQVGEQLAGVPPTPLAFDQDGFAAPEEWRDEFDHGTPVLDRVTDDSKRTLHIRAQGGRTRASWRTMIYLEPGRYRFQGQARTAGIRSGGTGLRISGDTRNTRLSGDNPWRSLRHDFEVKAGSGDVELVCEFDAYEGEVWFDLASLRLRRQ